MTRNLLDKRIKVLTAELAEMASLVEKQIYDSILALKNQDIDLADKVIHNDDKVDLLNKSIEEKCLKFMATESPMATDLRKIYTTSKIVTDLERMADYAVDISKITKRVKDDPFGEEALYLWDIVEIVTLMIKNSIEAFVNGDTEAAIEICRMDDKVDTIYRSNFEKILKKMVKDENLVTKGAQILFASKYLERMGDHVTNICEWILFSKTGDYVDLNE